jgi:2-polyprenyl-3-methyl-5-hydroxy-6-metoxy-1,4-benzoquinol methylase
MKTMPNPYELVRYTGYPFAQTHPDRLSTMGRIYGMNPPPIHQARVLEIGCCDGGNLIPMALSLPGGEFVGIDLTAPDIAIARQTAATLGIGNVQFHEFDLTNLPGPFGQFDYIVAHGIYSWIPPEVREKMLAVIQASLTPQGVAYVSYNALPGGYMRTMIRDMMQFHTRGLQGADEILAGARQILEFVVAASGRDSDYQAFIRKELEDNMGRPSYGLFHDELEEYNQPVYFHEFAAHAARCGLQFLAEANYFDMRPESAGGGIESPVFDAVSADPLLREQYLDFARCRRFRQTLLCHATIQRSPNVVPESFKDLYFASPAHEVPVADSASTGAREFHGPKDSKIKTAHPTVLRCMSAMVEAWPDAVPFNALCTLEADFVPVFEILNALFGNGLVEARTTRPNLVLNPGERPVASPLARWQAPQGIPITTLRNTSLITDGQLERRLIALLDGTRTRDDLFAELSPMLSTGKSEAELKAELEVSLNTLGKLCLLMA